MARDFDRIFARIGMGSAEHGYDHFIEQRSVRLVNLPVVQGVARRIRKSRSAREDTVHAADGMQPADADDRNGAASCRGGSADGIVEVLWHRDANLAFFSVLQRRHAGLGREEPREMVGVGEAEFLGDLSDRH